MLEITAVRDGLVKYLIECVTPKLDSKGAFIVGSSARYLATKTENLARIADSIPLVRALGAVQGDKIDWDGIHSAMDAQIQYQGKLVLDIPFVGMLSFVGHDLRDLHQCIVQQGG